MANNFCGELSAAHFLGINAPSLQKIHNVLKCVFDLVGASELISVLSSDAAILGNSQLAARISSEQVADSELLQRLFMVANPKWAHKVAEDFETVAWIANKSGKQILELRNNVERIYASTRVQHNTPGQTVLANIGGVKTLLPLLHHVAGHERSEQKFVYATTSENAV